MSRDIVEIDFVNLKNGLDWPKRRSIWILFQPQFVLHITSES